MFEVKTYIKKPVDVTAVHFTDPNDIQEIRNWIGEENSSWHHYTYQDKFVIFIKTLEGTMTADIGDYIIRGIKGEFYPCKPDIFEQTYEEFSYDSEQQKLLSDQMFGHAELVSKLRKLAVMIAKFSEIWPWEANRDLMTIFQDSADAIEASYKRAEMWKSACLDEQHIRVEEHKQQNEVLGDPRTNFGMVKRMNLCEFAEFLYNQNAACPYLFDEEWINQCDLHKTCKSCWEHWLSSTRSEQSV